MANLRPGDIAEAAEPVKESNKRMKQQLADNIEAKPRIKAAILSEDTRRMISTEITDVVFQYLEDIFIR